MKFSAFSVLGSCLLLAAFLIMTEWIEDLRISITTPAYTLTKQPRARVVLAMTTFSTRLELTALSNIQNIMACKFDRLIVTVPLLYRNETGDHCNYNDCKEARGVVDHNTVDSIVSAFQEKFGDFHPLKQSSNASMNFECGRIFLQILRIPDFGPATKILGALMVEKDPSTIIVTVDDDVPYPRVVIEALATLSPPDAVVCRTCQHYVKGDWFHEDRVGGLTLALRWSNAVYCPGWIMGVAGAVYRVGMFHEDVFEEARKLSRDCFLNDDVWLSGYLKNKGVPRIMLPIYKDGKHTRHSTLSLSAIRDAQKGALLRCARHYGFNETP